MTEQKRLPDALAAEVLHWTLELLKDSKATHQNKTFGTWAMLNSQTLFTDAYHEHIVEICTHAKASLGMLPKNIPVDERYDVTKYLYNKDAQGHHFTCHECFTQTLNNEPLQHEKDCSLNKEHTA
jgi:hypothetical protein